MTKKQLQLVAFALAAGVIVYATVQYPAAGIAAVGAAFALITEILLNFGGPTP